MKRFDSRSILLAGLAIVVLAAPALAGGWLQEGMADDMMLQEYQSGNTNSSVGAPYFQDYPNSYPHNSYKEWKHENYNMDDYQDQGHHRNRRQAYRRRFKRLDDGWHATEDQLKAKIRRARNGAEKRQLKAILADGQRVHRYFHEGDRQGDLTGNSGCLDAQTQWLERYGMQDLTYDMDYDQDDYQYETYEEPKEYPDRDWKTDDYWGLKEPGFYDMIFPQVGNGQYDTYDSGWNNNGNFCGTPQINEQLTRRWMEEMFGGGQGGWGNDRHREQEILQQESIRRQRYEQDMARREEHEMRRREQFERQRWEEQRNQEIAQRRQMEERRHYEQIERRRNEEEMMRQDMERRRYEEALAQRRYQDEMRRRQDTQRRPVYSSGGFGGSPFGGGGFNPGGGSIEGQMRIMGIMDGVFHIGSGAQENDDQEVIGGIFTTVGNVMLLNDWMN